MITSGPGCAALLSLISTIAFGQLTPGPDLNLSQKLGDDDECAIAVNPANHDQLFVACNTSSPGLFAARSDNGGLTWQYPDASDKTIADGNTGQGPEAFADPSVAWDLFGNLFLTYVNHPQDAIVTILSTDGGKTFADLAVFRSRSPDQPTVVAARSQTTSAAAVWVVWNRHGQMVAQGAPVTGLGAVGHFQALQTIPGAADCSFGDVAIAPSGAVVQVCETPRCCNGPATLLVNTDPDGLGPSPFGNAIVATTTKVGGFTFFPAQHAHGADAEAGLAFDTCTTSPHFGRLYLVYTDRVDQQSDDFDIMLRFSGDSGTTWSNPVRVNDDPPGRTQFLPRIAVDESSGNILVCWHDCRNSNSNTAMQEYCAMATPADAVPTFGANVPVGDAPSENGGMAGYGDYSGLAYAQSLAHPVWADASNSTGNNPDVITRLDVYVDRISSGAMTMVPQSLALRLPAVPVRPTGFFGLRAGTARPQRSPHSVTGRGWTASLDYLRTIDGHWNWDLRFGVVRVVAADSLLLSPNLRYVVNPNAPVRFFVNGGVGVYDFNAGGFEGGSNLGIGVNKAVGPHLQIEATFDHHRAFSASHARQFSEVQVGILLR